MTVTILLDQLPSPPRGKQGWPWTESGPELHIAKNIVWPRISIVTPSFNQAVFIEETIRSVLLQGYPNLEYIIIDGGSTDGSVAIIEKYAPWLSYWVSEPDKGQSNAINKGWSRATGHILAWLNSDDYYVPGTLARVAYVLNEAGPLVGLVHAQAGWIEPDGHVSRHIGAPLDLTRLLPVARSVVAQPSAFARADIVRQLSGVAEDLHGSMDWDLWNRIAVRQRTVFVPEVWSYIHNWENTKTNLLGKQVGFGPDMLKSVQRLYEEQDLPPEIHILRRRALAAIAVRAAIGYYNAGRYQDMQRTFFFALGNHPLYAIKRAGRKSLILASGSLMARFAP